MARRKTLNTYENQAKLSVLLAAVGGVAVVGAAWLLMRNFRAEVKWVVYDATGPYQMIFAATLLVSLMTAGAAFLLGLNSAGQRRNEQSKLSWLGFFLSAGVIALALCAGIFFYFMRQPIQPPAA